MAFAVTNTFTAAATFDPDDLDENFDDIEDVLNGGITTAHLSASAGITNSQLANDDFVFSLPLYPLDDELWAISGTFGATTHLPDWGGSTYTVVGYSWSCSDCGSNAGDGQFSVQWGSFTGASNAWALVTAVTGTVTIVDANAHVNDSFGSGGGTLNVDVTPVTSGRPRMFLTRFEAAGTGVLSAAGSALSVSLLIKRKNGLGTY